MSEPSVLQVFVFRDGAYVGNEIFTDPEITIGRGGGVDLALDDPAVAAQHAVLAHENGQATLLDLGSGYGSQINRTAIQHSYVTARDEIHIGGFTLKIKFVSNKPKLSAKPAPVDLRSQAQIPAEDMQFEQRTEVLATGNPAAAASDPRRRAQGKIPTAMIKPPSAESIDDLISSELGGITASLEISGSDVVEARNVTAMEQARSPARQNVPIAKGRPLQATTNVRAPTAPAVAPQTSRPPGPSTLAGLLDEATVSMQQNAQQRGGAPGFETLESALDSAFLGGDPAPEVYAPPAQPRSPMQALPTKTIDRHVDPPKARAPERAPPDAGPTGPIHLRQPQAPQPTFGSAPPPSQSQHQPAPHQQAAAFLFDDDDDDDDDDGEHHDADTRPPFSLLKSLVQKSEYPSAGAASLEIISFSKDEVRSSTLIGKVGDRYVLGRTVGRERAPRAGHPGLKLARITKIGEAVIEFPSAAEGMILDGDKKIGLDQLKTPQNAVSKKGDVFRATLSTRANATLTLGDVGFHLRFVRPPVVSGADRAVGFDQTILKAMGSSVIVHILAGVVVGLSTPGVTYSEATEKWADIKQEVRDVEVPPEPPPPPEPEPEPEPDPEEVTQDTPAPEPEKEPPKTRPKKAPKEEPKGVPEKEVKNAGILGAMGKVNLAAPGKKSMVQAVSSLDAVKAPGGSSFRVGALVGKMPSSEVSTGGGGGGGPLTKGGAAMLAGGSGFATIGKRTGTKVRGSVSKVQASGLKAQGSISREEVAAVINKHLSEVQYCYEKTLLKDPGLKGKLVLEWTINVDGSVGKVKQQTSTLTNPAVSSCIISSLKRWSFPKPKGGVVVVSYPFIFSSVGF